MTEHLGHGGVYGSAFDLLGRLTSLVRSFVSIPAGALEYALGSNWDSVHDAFRYPDYAALALLIAGAAALLVRSRRSVAA